MFNRKDHFDGRQQGSGGSVVEMFDFWPEGREFTSQHRQAAVTGPLSKTLIPQLLKCSMRWMQVALDKGDCQMLLNSTMIPELQIIKIHLK